jgi:hypothetical protein
MSDTENTPEIIFTFTTLDETVVTELESVFGQDDVSSSKRMTGGIIVDLFVKPIAELLGKVLEFKARQGDRIKGAKLTIGKDQISIEGYGADDALRLIDSEGLQEVLRKLHS